MKLLDWLKSRWSIFLLTDTPEWRCREVYYDIHGNRLVQDTYEPEDMVNNPPHYKHGGIETIELIKAFLTPEEWRGYLKGTLYAYRDRAPYKGQTDQDYEKAVRYWEWLQAELKGE